MPLAASDRAAVAAIKVVLIRSSQNKHTRRFLVSLINVFYMDTYSKYKNTLNQILHPLNIKRTNKLNKNSELRWQEQLTN